MRMKGLLGRAALQGEEGILLRPASSVHTAFMRFPIDVIFLDKENRIAKIAPNLRPWRTAAARHGETVIELAAGGAERRNLKVGDRIAEPAELKKTRTRRLPWKRAGADFALAALWLSFAVANLHEWPKEHRAIVRPRRGEPRRPDTWTVRVRPASPLPLLRRDRSRVRAGKSNGQERAAPRPVVAVPDRPHPHGGGLSPRGPHIRLVLQTRALPAGAPCLVGAADPAASPAQFVS